MIADPEQTLEELRRLRSAVIDASTAIYSHDAGFLSAAAVALRLTTTREVFAEVGRGERGFALPEGIRVGSVDEGAQVPPVGSAADRGVLTVAIQTRRALLSDDRKLLMAADRLRHPYYNALCLLELLLERGTLSETQHQACWDHLVEHARYSGPVLKAGRALHMAVVKQL
jgi:hypothetical protein